MRTVFCTLVVAATLGVAGCANMSETQKSTATGAGVGALAGAGIVAIAGGNAWGGAVVGSAVGASIGHMRATQ